MARIIYTHSLGSLSKTQTLWVYNGLDCCVTYEVFQKIPRPEYALKTYSYLKSLQAPLLDAMLRGMPIDMEKRDRNLATVDAQIEHVRKIAVTLGNAIGMANYNPNSNDQVKEVLYKVFGLPPIYETDKKTKEKKLSSNRDALEKCMAYVWARPFCLLTLTIRDLIKERSVLNSKVDEDGYMRCSYNITGAETFRLSSSENAFGGGTNFQNITDEKRDMFGVEPGYKLGYMDLEQAESRVVGLLAYGVTGKSKYLDACESGDLHTTVAKLVWPRLPWTGQLKADKAIAEQPFYRHFSYRDMAKRGGHGTNYNGQAWTMAKNLKVEVETMVEFQSLYFQEFPEIKEWHTWVAQQLQLHGFIDTPFGTRRYFLGRRWGDDTLREAIANGPQSTIGILTNLILRKLWSVQYDLNFRLRLQVHDAIIFSYPEQIENTLIPQIKEISRIPITVRDRTCIIPTDCKVGWNWRTASKENPHGLRKFPDDRTAPAPLSHRVFSGVY